jgi:murein DD-endopeptidase MepM/ murein hydrolase activator NlpD
VAGDKVDLSKEAIARIREERQAFRNAWDSSTYIRFWSGPFLRPTRSDRITSYFGERRIYNNGKLRNVHRGVDLAAGVGDPIKATAAGKVVLASFCYLEGGLIIMDHGGGLFTLYCHLSKLNVKAGDTVDKGHVIGLAGSTGRVTGPHLHWGCGVQGVRVDPMSLLELNKWLE